jgi:hypothetical protein
MPVADGWTDTYEVEIDGVAATVNRKWSRLNIELADLFDVPITLDTWPGSFLHRIEILMQPATGPRLEAHYKHRDVPDVHVVAQRWLDVIPCAVRPAV